MPDYVGTAALALLIVVVVLVIELAVVPARRRARLRRLIGRAFGEKAQPQPYGEEAMRDIASHYRAMRAARPDPADVDDISWQDLDMDQLFALLNRTGSGVGEEQLYAMLRGIGADQPALQRRIGLVELFMREPELSRALLLPLMQLGKERFHGAAGYLFDPASKRFNLRMAYALLVGAPLLVLAASFFQPALLLAYALLFGVSLVVYYRTEKRWRADIRAVRHLTRVLHCARALCALEAPKLSPELNELESLLINLKPIMRWNNRLGIEPSGDFDFLTVYVKIAFQTDMLSLMRLSAHIRRFSGELARAYALVGELDALIGVASLRLAREGICTPGFTGERKLTADQVTHPLLAHPVPNTIVWDQCLLITGSNASGKSTFTKALALSAITAQTLGIAFADRFVLPRARVLSSMAVRDDVVWGDSYFIAEIKSLRRILRALGPDVPALFFIDEVLRGTNTVERIAASSALLRHLARENALVMAATHDIELTELLHGRYENRHFRERLTDSGMVFDYKLMDGPARTRNAVALLSQLEFPASVVQEARDAAARFDVTRSWRPLKT